MRSPTSNPAKSFAGLAAKMPAHARERARFRAKAILDRTDGPIQHVRQEHPRGCAVAGVAMVARLTYHETLTQLGPGVQELIAKPHGGLWADAVFIALQRLGYAIALEWRAEWGKPRPDWTPTPIGDVNIAETMNGNGAHLVVVLADGSVLDPACDSTPRRLSDYSVNWIAGVVPMQKRVAS